MGHSDESFLPHIVGLFYATFDPTLGPTVLHQVPERLISSGSDEGRHSRGNSPSPARSASRQRGPGGRSGSSGPSGRRAVSRDRLSTVKPPTLLEFGPISEYVIPKKALHGKLVTFVTAGAWDEGFNSDTSDDDASDNEGDDMVQYRVIGLPSVIDDGEGGRYQRNQYMWNLCFVFRQSASLEAFEPVVRKTARILRSAELDSRYLSAPSPDHTPLNAVLEQIFEDLNSYSETSIPLDGFNSLELKLFPFYPNPSEVNDWDVPIPLVNFDTVKDNNWDITAARISKYIDGINHSAKIAQLADADLALTRETLKHMLYYQVIMMVDIFQYSNMYMVTAEFPKLTADETVMAECGVYVTRAGFAIPDWPTLAGLYARLLPGRTVHEWSTANRVHTRGTDERRFVSFGVVKGFLRRVHRWPVIVDRTGPFLLGTGLGPVAPYVQTTTNTSGMGSGFGSGLGSAFGSTAGAAAPDPARRRVGFQAESHDRPRSIVERERVIAGDSNFSHGSSMGLAESPSGGAAPSGDRSPPRRPRSFGGLGDVSKMGRSLTSGSAADTHPSISSRRTGTLRSGTLVMGSSARVNDKRLFELEDELVGLLDGHHHADEIQVRLGIGWAQLEKLLGLDEIRNGVGKRGVAVVYK